MDWLQKYPKFKNGKDCAYPERDNCNYDNDPKSSRCEYMKCISCGNWYCIYKNQSKSEQSILTTTKETISDSSHKTENTNSL